ncbi:MAG: TIM-barrel domain-containing protein [Chitinophagaceae bacterium]
MRSLFIFCLFILPCFVSAQVYRGHEVKRDQLSIRLAEGVLNIHPLTDRAIRVQWEKNGMKEEQQFVLNVLQKNIAFKVSAEGQKLRLSTKFISVYFDKQTGSIEYKDAAGKTFLREKAGGRRLQPDTVAEQSCFIAEQQFESPADEYLFGLGQFQDGHYNLKNITRQLIQVNSQIAIPFLYSSKGYGILWHQYGITDFNPADNRITLIKTDTSADGGGELEVTTTAGTQKVFRRQALYSGEFNMPKDGVYTIMLDLGGMDSRHLVVIDGVPLIDQSNQWLPPAASKNIRLKAGRHKVQVVCQGNNRPSLSWKMTEDVTTFRSPNAKSLDYIILQGNDADEVIAAYRNLTGNVPMLPRWAYGFWQCRERYTSGKHLVETVQEFRKRKLPVDVIVQDWQYWGKYGWGVPKFDEANYPEPEKFIRQLHDLNAKFSISVWENPDKKSEVAKDYLDKNLYIPNSPWIDIFNPQTQQTHWNALNKNLFVYGVDSWWMDATEPENDALKGKQTFFGPGEFYRLVYPFFVSKAVYDGQRMTDPNKRVVTLTRSAFPGQQRFGTINWSGDIGWDWDAYKRQIVAGLNFSLTGMPYWTTDIGGFFRPGRTQYTDPKYHDILLRWFQWGAFNTIFRMHGYQTETEPWKYGDTVMNGMRAMLDLRYRLMPYIYSEGWQISSKGSTMMRPMVMDFKNDTAAISQAYQYMFGKAFLVAPVTSPGVKDWPVYLPVTAGGWYDFWSGQHFNGGQSVGVNAPQDRLPLLVKAGSIVPMGPFIQYTGEKKTDTLEIRIYRGADGQFTLYNDEGDNYNYEKGNYQAIPFSWNDRSNTLTIGVQEGKYITTSKQYIFKIVSADHTNGYGMAESQPVKTITYTGKKTGVVLGNK